MQGDPVNVKWNNEMIAFSRDCESYFKYIDYISFAVCTEWLKIVFKFCCVCVRDLADVAFSCAKKICIVLLSTLTQFLISYHPVSLLAAS